MKIAKFLLCVMAAAAVSLTGCSSSGTVNESIAGTTASSAAEESASENDAAGTADTETSESGSAETSAVDKSETSKSETTVSESSEESTSGEEKSGESDGDKSEKKDSGSDESKTADNSNDAFTLKYAGQTVTLPCLVKDIDKLTIEEDSLFSAGEYCTGYFTDGNKELGNVFFKSSEDDKPVGDRTIIGLDFSPIECDGVDVEYKGLRIGDTSDKIKSVLGEPDEVITDADKYYDVKYKLDEKDVNKCVIIGSYDGIVNCISIYIM